MSNTNNKTLLAPGSNPVARISKKKPKDNSNGKGSSDYFQHQVNINENEMKTASRFIKDRADMNSDIIKLVPEIKQIRNITLSSIVSPNDFSKKELLPEFNNVIGFPETFVSKLKNITNTGVARYDLVDSLYDVADECLFNSGADVMLVMPRSMVETVIQESKIDIDASRVGKSFDLESITLDKFKIENKGDVTVDTSKAIKFDKKLSLINKKIDFECKLNDFLIEYNGNPSSLTIGTIRNDVMDDTLDNKFYKLGVDKEDIDVKTMSIYDKYKKNKVKHSISIGDIANSYKPDRKELPFTMNLKSSATMPLYVDRVDNHVGYIILTDEMFGNISNIPKESELVDSLMTYSSTSKDNVIASMLTKATDNLEIAKDAPVILSNMLEITESILLQAVQNAVNDSSYKSKMELNEENSLVRIMLYRALNNMKTRMIFVPKQYVSYIAFDYRDNGTGKSLLEDITLLASFKAMLTLSEIYAAINKNIPVTEIKATIDDDDPEPLKTKEMMEQDIYTSGSRRMIYGETSIEKHINWVSNSRFRITWVHKTFPKNDIESETKNKDNNYTVDTETGDRVMKAIIKATGLVPTALDDSDNVEFASVEMLKNALFNKINTERQDCLSNGISDRLRKLMLSDSVMIDAITDLIDSSSAMILSTINSTLEEGEPKLEKLDSGTKLQILKDCIENISVRLPMSENNSDVDGLKAKFDDYKTSLDSMFESVGESTFLSDVVAELGISKENVIGNIKLHLLMKWCEEHNYASGLSNFINSKDNKYITQVINAINTKDENIIKLAQSISKNKDKILAKIDKAKADAEAATNASASSEEDNVGEDGNPLETTTPTDDTELEDTTTTKDNGSNPDSTEDDTVPPDATADVDDSKIDNGDSWDEEETK